MEILETHGTKITQALPFASVLTLPATGSEMNSGGVVTRKSTQAKLSFSSPMFFRNFPYCIRIKLLACRRAS